MRGRGGSVEPSIAGTTRCGAPVAHEPMSDSCSASHGCSLDHHVRVRAEQAERAHPGDRRPVRVRGPWRRRRGDAKRQTVPVEVRRGVLEVQVGGDHAALHGQHHLDQARSARGRLEVSDVGLHRSDQQRLTRFPVPAVDGRGRLELDRVAELRGHSVSLEVVDVRRSEPRVRQGVLDDAALRQPVGRGRRGA